MSKQYPTPLDTFLEGNPRIYKVNELPIKVSPGMMAVAPGNRIFLAHKDGTPVEYYITPVVEKMP